MSTIATYLNKRSAELTKFIQQYNDETNKTVIAMLSKQKAPEDQTTEETQPVSTTKKIENSGPLEKEAKELFEKMHPKVEEKKRKRREKLGACVFMKRDGCECGKDATGYGENRKYKDKILCTVHYNQCRQRCWFVGCTKFAHLCKEHDQNKPAPEKVDENMANVHKKQNTKEVVEEVDSVTEVVELEKEKAAELERLEKEKAAELERLEKEKAAELERLEKERKKAMVEFLNEPDDNDMNEMSDPEGDESDEEEESEVPSAAIM